MKLDNRYEIRVVVILTEGEFSDTCYYDFAEFKKVHPYDSYKFGFIVYDTKNDEVPSLCNEWNDSPEEALFDYQDMLDHAYIEKILEEN